MQSLEVCPRSVNGALISVAETGAWPHTAASLPELHGLERNTALSFAAACCQVTLPFPPPSASAAIFVPLDCPLLPLKCLH